MKERAMCTVRKVLCGFRCVCDYGSCCKALCDVKFSQIKENGRKFCPIVAKQERHLQNFLTVQGSQS